MYTLFYYPRNASWAIHMLLRELQVEHKLVLVDRKTNAQKSPEYLKLNPTGRIPTLVIEDEITNTPMVMFESGAIAQMLCERHSQSDLYPMGLAERAKATQWLFFLTTTFAPEMMLYFYPEKHTLNQSETAAIKAAHEQRVGGLLVLLDDQLSKQPYLIGEQFTLCDCFLFMMLHWASQFKKPPIAFPNLRRYMSLLATRQSVMESAALEGTDLSNYSG